MNGFAWKRNGDAGKSSRRSPSGFTLVELLVVAVNRPSKFVSLICRMRRTWIFNFGTQPCREKEMKVPQLFEEKP